MPLDLGAVTQNDIMSHRLPPMTILKRAIARFEKSRGLEQKLEQVQCLFGNSGKEEEVMKLAFERASEFRKVTRKDLKIALSFMDSTIHHDE